MGFLALGIFFLLIGIFGTLLPAGGLGAILVAVAWAAIAFGMILIITHVAVGPRLLRRTRRS